MTLSSESRIVSTDLDQAGTVNLFPDGDGNDYAMSASECSLEEQGDADWARRQYLSGIELTQSILDSPFFARLTARAPETAAGIVRDVRANLERRLARGDDTILKARLGKVLLSTSSARTSCWRRRSRELPNLPLVWFNLGEARQRGGRRESAWDCHGKAPFLDISLAGPPCCAWARCRAP